MVLTRKLKYDNPRLSMGGIGIELSQEIKILGLTVDAKLTFNTHVTEGSTCELGLHPEVIRVIYTAAVEPIIMYAAGAWAPATTKLGVRKQLNVVQRGFAQKLCRAYRTVSLNSALVLAGILPLDLRIREVATLYKAKRGVPQPVLGDREVERMAPMIKAPHPAEQVNLEFKSLIDEEQYEHYNNFEVRIFTDGSKLEGKAELLALQRAVREALNHSGTAFGIFSDSMSALQTVTNVSSPHPLAVETRDTIRRCMLQNKSVSLFWIKAHVGLEGNERADQLAKEAALRSKRKPDYDLCPISFVRRQIRLETLDEWDRRYRSGRPHQEQNCFPKCVGGICGREGDGALQHYYPDTNRARWVLCIPEKIRV
uniref:RNase H type-1 domain-containing protein n=1 Tax=Bombyx mori TaxID=7091 RepID=A0A8R2R5A2_BOMMO|nr:uncharacterized protein LOC119631142 [Bombyx mori]